jgi:hypothetical protein
MLARHFPALELEHDRNHPAGGRGRATASATEANISVLLLWVSA